MKMKGGFRTCGRDHPADTKVIEEEAGRDASGTGDSPVAYGNTMVKQSVLHSLWRSTVDPICTSIIILTNLLG